MTDQQTRPTVNTTDMDFGYPSLRAIASAIGIPDAYDLPEGWRLDQADYRDCMRPGARSGEVIVSGTGPEVVYDEWDDDPDDLEPGETPQHHVETDQTYWGFRIRIDQIGGA